MTLCPHLARARGLALFTLLAWASCTVVAGEADQGPAGCVAVFKSPHFLLHTDLPAGQAEQMLARMETTLRFASRYWGRSPRGRVNCYVVANLDNWSDDELPHPLARVWVGAIGGATLVVGDDNKAHFVAKVYSSARRGIIEHEVVHAYCAQTFGALGPDWYKEGMADVAMMHFHGKLAVNCSAERIDAVRSGPPRTVQQIIAGERFTHGMSDSLGEMLKGRQHSDPHVPVSRWSEADAENLQRVKESYAWSWALCHMLVHNPNYAKRFRALGGSYMSQRQESFQRAFAAMDQEIAFEFQFFTERMDVGYRVDLCSWDWHQRFRTLKDVPTVNSRIVAARGFQPSGLMLDAGRLYRFNANGTWATSTQGQATDANGDAGGRGKLIGVVMNEFRLSKRLELGSQGSFVAPSSGKLYLRCKDAWNELADNHGEVQVQFTE